MRFDITKPLNQNFFLSHSLFMGNMELGAGGRQILKAPMGTYEFGANIVSEKVGHLIIHPSASTL
jgi:mitochondrial import receptor subunit TOM40